MGWGFDLKVRVYDKIDKRKVFYMEANRYREARWKLVVNFPPKFLDATRYYCSVVWETCDDPNQCTLQVNDTCWGSTQWDAPEEYDPALEPLLTRLKSGEPLELVSYNRKRVNFYLTQTENVFWIRHSRVPWDWDIEADEPDVEIYYD
ncbi:hypothetical protein MIV077R [Invertebrate iridescent virus 3]|uniref:Uncharacterized protein 077R n=1 Tax=Invertebrate iridescent virus 3 TaxID=345201 RepID=077R_IIV3|nr:hypothetical protein MIV077R [Invertebrate iridescent virus 3]Q196Y3.1 RecName: Full=Uncharacterized protein 077R [Invertebrate iridescent virus 3]ABF82107.1 hypothetical protein MIV077R [Invertebrate iridescent virus 3]